MKTFAFIQIRLPEVSMRFVTGSTSSISKSIKTGNCGSCIRAGVKKFRIYDLRHTFASRMAMAGGDLITLAALLGHNRVQMVMRYAHPVEEHKIDAIQKLEYYKNSQHKAS